MPVSTPSPRSGCGTRGYSRLAGKVRYVIDPDNPYPNEFTGHVRARLANGTEVEERQPHMRGGAHEPLSRADLESKFRLNCAYGGWPRRARGAVPRVRVAGVRRRDRPRALSGLRR